MPGLRRLHGGFDRDHGIAKLRSAHDHRPRRFASGVEQAAIEGREDLRRRVRRGGRAAAEALEDVAADAAERQAQAGRHHISRNGVQVGKVRARAGDPLDLALLQLQRLGHDGGDIVEARMRRAVGRNQEIGGDGGEAGGRYHGHAQRQTDFEIEPRAVPHRRAPGANGFVAAPLDGRTYPAQSRQALVRCTVVKISRPSPGPAPLHGLIPPSRLRVAPSCEARSCTCAG